jgi:hypothetical protein
MLSFAGERRKPLLVSAAAAAGWRLAAGGCGGRNCQKAVAGAHCSFPAAADVFFGGVR